jgi:hypothetical protein
VDTARNLQFGGENVAWGLVALKLVLLGVVLLALAAVLIRRRFKMGLRA